MRIILSLGRVNIFNLAKNAGTSVEQIERFYAKNLPPLGRDGEEPAELCRPGTWPTENTPAVTRAIAACTGRSNENCVRSLAFER
jgi:hypothetical protein